MFHFPHPSNVKSSKLVLCMISHFSWHVQPSHQLPTLSPHTKEWFSLFAFPVEMNDLCIQFGQDEQISQPWIRVY